jgi:hypothetical protein
MEKLVEEATLGQGERTAQEPLSQDANLLGVKAIEVSYGVDPFVECVLVLL